MTYDQVMAVLAPSTMTTTQLLKEVRQLQKIDDQAALPHPAQLLRRIIPKYVIRPHIQVISDNLERIFKKEIDRLIITTPPQVGKTVTAVVGAAYWWLANNPTQRLIIGSYGDQLAVDRGRDVRTLIRKTGHRYNLTLSYGSESVQDWRLETGGGIRSVGVGSGIAGTPGDLVIIDDPHKNREETESLVYRDRVYNWYSADILSRVAPDAPVIVVMCMTGDTPVLMADGTEKPLRDIRPGNTIATYESGGLTTSVVRNWSNQGPDMIYRIRMKSGTTVRANARHPFLTVKDGIETWMRTDSLELGSSILRATGENIEAPHAQLTDATSLPAARTCVCPITTKLNGLPDTAHHLPYQVPAHVDLQNSKIDTESRLTITNEFWNNRMESALSATHPHSRQEIPTTGQMHSASITATTPEQYAAFSAIDVTSQSDMDAVTLTSYVKSLSTWNVVPDEVIAVEPAGKDDVYDVQVDRTENFIANGLVSHNTRWHQDDLAARVMRDEGTTDQGGRWHLIRMPALCDDPENDPLGRAYGEPLTHPKIATHDTERALRHWNGKRSASVVRDWFSLYMCDPRPVEGALVTAQLMRDRRHYQDRPEAKRSAVAVDPSGGGRDTAGIIGGYLGTDGRLYITADRSKPMPSHEWSREACQLAAEIEANVIVFEKNYGGDMARRAIRTAWEALQNEEISQFREETLKHEPNISATELDKRIQQLDLTYGHCPQIKEVVARKSKVLRAEPVAQIFMEDKARLGAYLPELESEWCTWQGSGDSPGRIDASVYLAYELVPKVPTSGRKSAAPNGSLPTTRFGGFGGSSTMGPLG